MKALWTCVKVILALALAGVALAAALLWWIGSSSSLATALQLAQPYLPAGQQLEFKDVSGSVRHGGRIGWLRWQQGALSVEARQIQVAWSLRSLFAHELRLSQLTAEHLRIEDSSPPRTPTTPADLRLPFKVNTPFSVGTLDWAGATPLQISALSGNYIFDSYHHKVDGLQAHISSGTYTLSGQLQAQAPMALTARLDGHVQTTLPANHQAMQVQAHADISGALADVDAVLNLSAQLQPERPGLQAMQASVSARLQPWQAQPVVSAQAQWQLLDLAALWPQAPQTRLTGAASVKPEGQTDSKGWRAELSFSNSASGPWNQAQLPIERLHAQGVFMQGQWTIESLQATGAGGHIQAKGHYNQRLNWQGQASLQGLQPQRIDSRWFDTVVDGHLSMQQAPAGLLVDSQLQAQDAKLLGKFTINPQTLDAQGLLELTLPGATARVQGQLARTEGAGALTVKVSEASQLSRWLQRWPGIAEHLSKQPLQGGAELSGHWQGGWQNAGQSLQLQAQINAPQLELGRPDQTDNWRLRELQADLSGNLRALTLSVKGLAQSGTRQFTLQAQAQGGQASAGVWQAQLNTAQLSAQDTVRPGTWLLQTSAPIALTLQSHSPAPQLTIAPGSVQLSGPVPGSAKLNWQTLQWSPAQWNTEGNLQNLPLAWLDLIGQTQMANLGLRGDLLFAGQWSATGGDTLRLRASLERSSGDLQLLTEDSQLGTVRAGVREARLTLTVDADAVAAQLNWDSERAGQAQAQFSTRLKRADAQWLWPADAPLSGSLSAKLPPVGAWSLLAPPGWRLRGTLDASATLTGSRQAPHWQGRFSAQDLAVRSVVDGIDFSQGQLSASLDGQRLNIDAFTLQGAGGASGGLLTIKGAVLWLPVSGPNSTLASRLRMRLNATAQSLRVSTRADRRLSVSGQIAAELNAARLNVTGTLVADQALFILPEDSAPQLGDDVVLRKTRTTPARTTPKPGPSQGVRVRPEVNINLDLGPDFAVRGHGINTRLAGKLALRSVPEQDNGAPTLIGELSTVRGTFKAYDQQLNIEEGLLRFSGPLNNPALNILAIRPNLSQRVGVQVSGTALSPVIRLYAEPELPDAEKLAWLVLGRSAANGGAESAVLQQAALALLGGKGKSITASLAEAIGLDELSMRSASSNTDGSSAGAAVTLGKRISRDIYVAYERSLAGTLGTFYIFYDLSRRFTLRAQTGAQSAVDLIFTLRYD